MEIWAIYASYWNQIPGIKANAFGATSGTQIFFISEGTAEAGQVYGSEIVRMKDVKNLPPGKTKAVTNVSSMWSQSVLEGCVFVRADSPIQKMEDLKGKNIATNTMNPSGFGGTAFAVMEAAGVTVQNAGAAGGKISQVATNAGLDGLQDKTFDAFMYGGSPGGPSPAVLPVEQTTGLRVIHPSQELITKALQLHPEFAAYTIDWSASLKAEKTPFQLLGDVLCCGVANSLPNDLVFQMCKQVVETDMLAKVRAVNNSHWTKWPENARIGSAIWGEHPGAKQYYDQKGIPINTNWVVKEK
jgi:TRAP transporter TAXI family solute receptor